MSLPNIDCDVKSSGRACDTWSLEWTFGSSGAVTLDTDSDADGAWTDQDPRVTTPVADGGTGIVNITFPKCRRVRVLHCSVEPATADLADPTDYRFPFPVAIVPSAGTMKLYLVETESAGALADAETGARGRLVLQLEYN